MNIKFRPYQEAAIKAITSSFKEHNKQICVLPTGSGKTVVFCEIIKQLNLKTLVIAHTREILNQIHTTLVKLHPSVSLEMYTHSSDEFKDVYICSLQSAVMSGTLKKLEKMDFDLLIIDECHRSCSKGYRKIIDKLGFDKKKLLGFTATPFRTDKQSVYDIFEHLSFSISIIDMIEEGFLVDFVGYRVKTPVSLKNIRKQSGDFIARKLEPVINVKNRNELIVKEYQNISPGEKAIAFCVSVKHAYDLRSEFLDNGISCEVIEGKMSKAKRDSIIEKFRTGKIQVLSNCNILTEGYDEPSVTTLLMARPTISKTLYIQMIGRGSRLYSGKPFCKVIEFTDNDFEVESLENLINYRQKKIKMRSGESFQQFNKRFEKELLEATNETVVEEHTHIIKRNFLHRFASPWQLDELKKRNILFHEPLLDITANYLLNKEI